MTCSKCGTVAAEGAPFCSVCGASLQLGGVMPPIPPPPPAPRTSGMAIAGFVLSFVCSLLGLIFSILGRNECKASGGKLQGEGLALAGIIISIVQLALAVIGILAAIAIPAFLDYNIKSRHPEAEVELTRIERAIKIHYETYGELPVGEAPPTPARSCCDSGGRCLSGPDDWSHPIWEQLSYRLYDRHYFQYRYVSTHGRAFVVEATGDLDCDGVAVTYTLTGQIVGGELQTAIIKPVERD